MEKKLKSHLFICTSCTFTCKDNTESDPALALNLRKNLKTRARTCFSKNEVRVSAVTCLGECEHGIAGVLYPQGEWFLGLRPEDEDSLFEKLVQQSNPTIAVNLRD